MLRQHRILFVLLLGLVALTPALAINASLTIFFTIEGDPLADPLHAKFYIYELGKRDEYLAWGHGAKPAHFPEGIYDVVIRYKNDHAVQEIVREEIELIGDLEEEIDFTIPLAALTLDVTSGGQSIQTFTGRYALYRPGKHATPLARKRPGERLIIRRGTYDIEVSHRDAEGLKTTWLEDYFLEGVRYETVEL